MDWGTVPTWLSSITALATLLGAVLSWLWSRVSKSARDEARAARDDAAAKLAAINEIAAAAARAFPEPKDVDLRIEPLPQAGLFRMRNVGTKRVANIAFVRDPAIGTDLPDAWNPHPRWQIDGSVTLEPSSWADFTASAMSPIMGNGRWTQVFPKEVFVTFDEATEPVALEVPTSRGK